MARPAYTLCAHSCSQDRQTGLYSVFEFVEKVELAPLPTPKEGEKTILVRGQQVVIAACWMIETEKGETFEDEFEIEICMLKPSDGKEITLVQKPFKFGVPERQPLSRVLLRIEGALPLDGPGLWLVQSRIRKVGADQWTTQEYPVIVEGTTNLKLEGIQITGAT